MNSLIGAFFAISTLLLMYVLVGFPLLRLICPGARDGVTLLLAPVAGWMLITLLTSWCVQLGFAPMIAIGSLAILGILWWLASLILGGRSRLRPPSLTCIVRRAGLRFLVLVALICSGLIAIYSRLFTNPTGQFSFIGSVGPDGLGYAMAGQSIARGVFAPELHQTLVDAFPNVPESLSLSPLTGAVYSLPSFSTQAAIEFISGAGRFGWAGFEGLLLDVLEPSDLWLVQFALSTASILLLIPLFVTAHRGVGAWLCPKTLLFGAMLAAGPFLAYSWAQGGSGQVFILPAFTVFIFSFLGLIPRGYVIPLSALSVSVMLSTYADALTLSILLCVLLAVMVASRLMRNTIPLRRILMGSALGLVLFLPGALKFPVGLLTRSVDAGQAGWQVPSNFSILRVLGLQSPLTSSNQILGLSPLEQVPETIAYLVVPTAILLSLTITIRVLRRRSIGFGSGLLLASLTLACAIFLLTQVRQQNTNYQLMKAVSLLLPILGIGLLNTDLNRPGLAYWPRTIQARWNSKRLLLPWAMAVGLSCILLINAQNWTRDFRTSATFQPTSSVDLTDDSTTEDAFRRFNFVIDSDSSPASNWNSLSLGTLGNFRWLNRAGVSKLNSTELTGELALATTTNVLRGFPLARTIGNVASRPSEAPTLSWVPLGVEASRLVGMTAKDACNYTGLLWAARGLPVISGCQIDTKDQNGTFLGVTSEGRRFESGACPVSADHWRALLAISNSLQTGDLNLLDTGTYPGGLQILANRSGEIRINQIGADNSGWLIGYRDADRVTLVTLESSGSRILTTVNSRETSIDLPMPIACSSLTLGRELDTTWQPFALRATSVNIG